MTEIISEVFTNNVLLPQNASKTIPAADPLSGDLYVLCGDGAVSLGSDRHGVQRLVPAGPDRYALQPFVSHLGRAGPGGIAFSPDGRQLIITDDGSRAIVVLRRTY